MKKTYGVCLGLLALGFVGLGAPASRAHERLATDEAGSGSETSATSATNSSSSPTASSPADLRQRIDALKAELADLNSELAAGKDPDGTIPAAAPQDQGAPAPAAPAPAATTPPAPMPLPSPSMTAPLATALPHEVSAGPLGKIEVTGILSGIGITEGYHLPGDSPTHWDLSNAQVFIQKTTGWFQWYLQGGAYNIPALGVPFTQTGPTLTSLYGPFPTAYVKLVKGNFNVEVGELPTLVGAEYTFTFENMNIERGLLWGQENAITRGIQLNETYKKLTAAFSWNDGYYSDRYTSFSGSLALAINAANTLTFVASGNAGAYNKSTTATPLYLNNSSIYNLIYMYSKGNFMIMPYFQYSDTPKDVKIGITDSASTRGGAILANYNFKHGISLAVRPEYIKSSGNPKDINAINLLAGPDSGAFSFTVTPSYTKDAFFLRADFSVVHITDSVPGYSFGTKGNSVNQPRGVIEAGFLF
jgi:hypothetical protein